MKNLFRYFFLLMFAVFGVSVLSSFLIKSITAKSKIVLPYKQAGLTERQAAAHLLSRFTFGARPGDVDAAVKMGLDKWLEQQLDDNLRDDSLNTVLDKFDALKMSNEQIVNTFPKGGQVLRMAIKDGVIDKDSAKTDRKEYRDKLQAYMQQKGLRPEQELLRQFYNQKVLRAAYSNNQLREVLTDFWFNHFNVSVTKNDCSQFIPDYERDVIRPNVTAKFGDLLLATAKSPAMLYYLDNFSSVGTNANQQQLQNRPRMARLMQQRAQNNPQMADAMQKVQQNKKTQGLNENYAREVMELHTLGVDGGYTQQDVTQAARVLTGWTVFPMGQYAGGANAIQRQIERFGEQRLADQGMVHDGDFLFAPNRHDNGEKTVLGKKFGPDGGYHEGVELLNMLAHHPSTAKFITKKLAVRFVSDAPPQSLLDKMTKTFMDKDGDIREVLITMVSAPEFWNAQALREKTKSPFELVISSVRSLNAQINQPFQLYTWTNKMGQRLYGYQAPTGFPDRGQYWINTGALLNRMNFGLALATERIPGVRIDLAALNDHHEPESPQAALTTYSKLIMPERNLDQAIKQLTPMLNDPNLVKKVSDAADKATPKQPAGEKDMNGQEMMMANADMPRKNRQGNPRQAAQGNNSMLSQVVGVIIGSPEFQRR